MLWEGKTNCKEQAIVSSPGWCQRASWVQKSLHNKEQWFLCHVSAPRWTPAGISGRTVGSQQGGLYLSPPFRACLIGADPPPLGQCQAPPQDSTTADNRLVWLHIQTLKPKQPWQLSTRNNVLLHDMCINSTAMCLRGFSPRMCAYVQSSLLSKDVIKCARSFGTAYPQFWLNATALLDSVLAADTVSAENSSWGDLSWRRNQRHLCECDELDFLQRGAMTWFFHFYRKPQQKMEELPAAFQYGVTTF